MISLRIAQKSPVIKGTYRRLSRNLQFLTNCTQNTINKSILVLGQGKQSYNLSHNRFCEKQDIQIRNMAAASETSGFINRLAQERSPYLLQHSTNPVDWYPWGDEAFDKAKQENKLIFLSVGYSTCHWCHVMEKESFESEAIAKILNESYVSIKVDREERPDVDKLYMMYVQRTTGSGGWPMSVFLTPTLAPLFGGTYYPVEDNYGRLGFKSLLLLISRQWTEDGDSLHKEAKHHLKELKTILKRRFPEAPKTGIPNKESWSKCLSQFVKSYDARYGGFSGAPKFPQPSIFNFLFHMYSKNKKKEEGKACLDMCLHTLTRMAYGGIHDHVNNGYARYSVDQKWQVPHFEKMLYDQAQLVVSYIDAYIVTKNDFFGEQIHDILKYVARDLSNKEGGFYGAQDADSYPRKDSTEKKEGAFCVWEYGDINILIKGETDGVKHFDLVVHHYGIKEDGNVSQLYDPHKELLHKNVLCCVTSYEDTAAHFKVSVQVVRDILAKAHAVLRDEGLKRPRPNVDTKMITSWNGLMIAGFAKAGFALKEDRYTDRAILAANFVKTHLYDEETRTLQRCCYRAADGGVAHLNVPISGFVDDYAFLIRGLLHLYEATMDSAWLEWAEQLQDKQDETFWDAEGFGYFTISADDPNLTVRDKEDQDGAEPCGNSVSVHNLLRLSAYMDRSDLREKAYKTLSAFGERLREIPVVLPEMTSALMFYHEIPTQVFIAGSSDDNNTQALLDVVRTRLLPGRILAVADGPTGRAGLLYTRHESLANLKPIQGKSAAYVCRNFACSLPVTDPEELATSLDAECKRNRRSSRASASSDSD